jgi:hypothetical protein
VHGYDHRDGHSRRGDDTVAPASAYWDNICRMLGKGIG